MTDLQKYAEAAKDCADRALMYHKGDPERDTLQLAAKLCRALANGWVLVPKEPTYQMIDAWHVTTKRNPKFVTPYKAMLAAAPSIDTEETP